MQKQEIKSKVDKLWLEFHSGGITNPLTVIEQLSYLIFARMLDIREQLNEKRASKGGKREKPIFTEENQNIRWSQLIHMGAEEQLAVVQKDLFPFFRDEMVRTTTLGAYMKDAQCLIQKPSLLKTAINTINDLPLLQGDTKGDLYEYMLSKLTTAGVAGQFRTPRHIIGAMVRMVDPQPTDEICDPACGTAGFLIETMAYLREKYSSRELVVEEKDEATGEVLKDAHGQPIMNYPGDLLEEYRDHIQDDMFHGFDFDSTMLRIAAMNMLLHGIESPSIEYEDTLLERFPENYPEESENAFDVILANPPFKGSIDADSVHKSLTSVAKTKKTELLFLVLIERMLKKGGRAAVIVPDGVLFGSSNAHQAVRRMLLEESQLQAVVSLPSGVFKPYAGVSTAVLLFTKAGRTDHVWFYKVESDGYSLDDKRTPEPDSDLPDLLDQWQAWNGSDTFPLADFEDRTKKAFYVPKDEIVGNKYDLSINRYREIVYEEIEYDKPKDILTKLRDLENEILTDIDELESMLG